MTKPAFEGSKTFTPVLVYTLHSALFHGKAETGKEL